MAQQQTISLVNIIGMLKDYDASIADDGYISGWEAIGLGLKWGSTYSSIYDLGDRLYDGMYESYQEGGEVAAKSYIQNFTTSVTQQISQLSNEDFEYLVNHDMAQDIVSMLPDYAVESPENLSQALDSMATHLIEDIGVDIQNDELVIIDVPQDILPIYADIATAEFNNDPQEVENLEQIKNDTLTDLADPNLIVQIDGTPSGGIIDNLVEAIDHGIDAAGSDIGEETLAATQVVNDIIDIIDNDPVFTNDDPLIDQAFDDLVDDFIDNAIDVDPVITVETSDPVDNVTHTDITLDTNDNFLSGDIDVDVDANEHDVSGDFDLNLFNNQVQGSFNIQAGDVLFDENNELDLTPLMSINPMQLLQHVNISFAPAPTGGFSLNISIDLSSFFM